MREISAKDLQNGITDTIKELTQTGKYILLSEKEMRAIVEWVTNHIHSDIVEFSSLTIRMNTIRNLRDLLKRNLTPEEHANLKDNTLSEFYNLKIGFTARISRSFQKKGLAYPKDNPDKIECLQQLMRETTVIATNRICDYEERRVQEELSNQSHVKREESRRQSTTQQSSEENPDKPTSFVKRVSPSRESRTTTSLLEENLVTESAESERSKSPSHVQRAFSNQPSFKKSRTNSYKLESNGRD